MNFFYIIAILTSGLATTGVTCYEKVFKKPLSLHRKLKSMDNDTDIRMISMPKSITFSAKERQLNLYTLKDEIASTVNEFVNILGSVEHIDLSNLYNNFRSYNIISDTDLSEGYSFDALNMTIQVSANHIHDMLIMALFYLASTDRFWSTTATGFIRKTEEYKLGFGLTRGYVEILSYRYFGIELPSMHYDMIDDIAGCIEVIVGREKMEKLFFTGALDELVEELSLYSSKEEAIKTIREIDHMEAALKSGFMLTSFLSSKTYRNLSTLVADMLRKKLSTIEDDQISELEYTFEVLCDFLNSLYINGPTIFKVPKKEMYKMLALTRKDLGNRGMTVKID